MTSPLVRLCCEHEAAHAVVAAHYGMRVHEIRVGRDGSGCTVHEVGRTARQAAAVTAAGDVWNREFGSLPYADLGCLDLAEFERDHGMGALWQAQRAAREILTQHRRAVLALADRLAIERVIIFTRNRNNNT